MNENTRFKYCLASMMEYVEDIYDVISRVDYVEQAFSNKIYRHALNSCIIQLGELAKRIQCLESVEYDKTMLPVQQMYGMRCKMVHNYGGIDYGVMKRVIENDLPLIDKYIRSEVIAEVIDNPEILFEVEYEDLVKETVRGLLADATPRSEQTNNADKIVDHDILK